MRRAYDVIDMNKLYKLISITKCPNKDNFEESLMGNLNLIKLAFDSRKETFKFKL